MGNDETIWIDVEETGAATDAAILLETEVGEIWLPRSQIKARKKDDGKLVRIEITRWIAKTKGFIDEKDDR